MNLRSLPFKKATLYMIIFVLVCLSVIALVWIKSENNLRRLPHVFDGDGAYKAKPYLSAAIHLQSEGRELACRQLLTDATNGMTTDQIYVLCRLLFVKRPLSDFRSAILFTPHFLGETEANDWPMDPIEIMDGVPFCIVSRYSGMGGFESQENYLEYCMKNCDWSSNKFRTKSNQELSAALTKLLKSPKWKHALTPEECAMLNNQIN